MPDVTSPFGFPYPEDTDLVRDGAQDIENLATGVNDYLTGGYIYAGTRYYQSSGQFDKDDPFGDGNPSSLVLRAVRVRMVGGGGGGGSTQVTGAGESASSNGGAGAGYAESFIVAGDLSSSETVTVGDGGVAVSAGTGTNGGSSSFGSLVSAEGGEGGGNGIPRNSLRANRPSVAGGGGSGQLVVPGQGQGVGVLLDPASTSGAARYVNAGGGSVLGPGYQAQHGSGNINGEGFGSGGGGANATPNSASQLGGAGSDGIVIVDCFV
jgi:hypothetical protein